MTLSYEYPSFTIENDNLQSKPHCQKCGRRSRNHHTYINNRRVKNEPRHCHQLKCERQQRKSNKNNILIDQLIEVQQVNAPSCTTESYDMDNDYNKDKYRRLASTVNSQNSSTRLKRAQQMVYLRENINNLSYREIHFSNEYIILKRLEEKNNLLNQNRIKVDHYFRSFKLQYQTISTLFQNINITSFTYSKQEPYQSELIVKRCSINDSLDLPIESLLKSNDTSTMADQTDSPILSTTHHEYKHQQYSQNANINDDRLAKTKKQNLVFDTAVIIDVRKCPQNRNHVRPTWSMPLLKTNQQESFPITTIPNPSIYFDQNPQVMDIHQSQNSNYTHQQHISTDSIFYHPIYNKSTSNISYETTKFHSNIKESNEHQFLTTSNHLFPTNSSIRNLKEISSSKSQKSLSTTNSDTTSNISTTTEKKAETLNKIKQILNTLQRKLLNQSTFIHNERNNSLPPRQISPLHIIDRSISLVMTSDSLVSNTSIQTTYSVSSTLPILNKNISQLPHSKSTVYVEDEILQIELDSLNNNSYPNRTKSKIKFLNSAKNINRNQQTSEDDQTKMFSSIQSRSRRESISRHITVQYMSPSFMFVLQILLVICLINRISMYYLFGIVSTDTFASLLLLTIHNLLLRLLVKQNKE